MSLNDNNIKPNLCLPVKKCIFGRRSIEIRLFTADQVAICFSKKFEGQRRNLILIGGSKNEKQIFLFESMNNL